jgi:hypothetical protein
VAAGDQRPRTGVRLGDGDDVEAVGEQRKLGQVRDLGDQARPDDPQPDSHGERLDHSLSAPIKDRKCPSI